MLNIFTKTNKFVGIRFESYNTKKAVNAIRHNTRTTTKENINSKLSSSNYCKNDNKEAQKLLRNYTNEYKENFKKINKRSLREERSNTLLESVIYLSPHINDMLKDNKISKNELHNLFKKSIDAVQVELKKHAKELKLINIHVHWDEETPHLHAQWSNGDLDGLSIMNKIKKTEILSKMQDIAAEPFNTINFTRGISKDITKKEHSKIGNKYTKELENTLAQLKAARIELKDNKTLIKTNKGLRSQLKDLNASKEDYKKIDSKNKELRNINKTLIDTIKNLEKLMIKAKIEIEAKNKIEVQIKEKNEIIEKMKKNIENKDESIKNLKAEIKDLNQKTNIIGG